MIDRLERSEGLGTIYPAMMNSIFALLAEARDVDDPLLHREIKFLERYEIEEKEAARFAFSPAFRRFGIRPSRWYRLKRRGSIRRILHSSPRSAGCSRIRFLARAIGR